MLQTNIHAKFEENSSKHVFMESTFLRKFTEYSGYVMSLEDAIKLIKEYEVNTTTFTVAYQNKGFGNSAIGKNDFNYFSSFYKILLLIIYC